MPCRKESFLLLEQSVTVGSGEVDTLVARIGEALQLNAQRTPTSCSMAYGALKPVSRAGPSCSCVRGRSTPYPVCTPRGAARHAQHHHHHSPRQQGTGGNKRLCGRGWGRCNCRKHAGTEEEDDPHELLQELLLSGNLIKEAVRRLHMAGESPDPPGSRRVSECTETTVQ
ncbi:GSK-3-binding protein [Xenopus laevis]|uniref:GSK-3-binding protein n=1 Tax=Xenopus laevis TaxID=8355 RepID=GBP_XENLA|nr:GSK-3-binding protein [Xenopus laevis]O93343.1 RecName: Full=GSK-3-binding protein; Short=GBP [Xenopus laevis]AAC41303.1 GSK-3 binding protein GBP [Xenopus laevis]AAH76771.1 GBP protein [Xenopus laevis]